jgi:hypothetical protein
VRWNAQDLAGVDYDFLPVNPELESAIEDVCQLLVVVAVLGNDAAFFQQHPRHHDFLSDYELTLQERVEFFERNGVPGDVLQGRRAGRMLGNGPLGAGMRFCDLLDRRLGASFRF